MKLVAAVAIGGAIGSVARYLLTLGLARWLGPSFPWGTLAVNGVGTLILGVVVGVATVDPRLSPTAKAAIGTGFCGGFTTFSTFSIETLRMPLSTAAINVGANLAVSLAGGAIGLGLARLLRP
ncbi:MAG: fluoride efflux transporter CrcB [Myxococcota bacterium]